MFGAKIIDAVGEKSGELSDKLIEEYRTHVGEELLGREEQIAKREAELNNRESALVQREQKLALCIAVPKFTYKFQ